MKMKTCMKKKIQEAVNRNEKGFTLLELIFIAVIVGILAAVVIPKMNSVSSVDVFASASQVKSDIRFAQQLAMSKFMKTRITFDDGSDYYFISYANSGGTIDKFLPPGSRAAFGADYSYEFNSSGEPTDIGGFGWNIVISSGVQTKQVVMSDQTGRATIQ